MNNFQLIKILDKESEERNGKGVSSYIFDNFIAGIVEDKYILLDPLFKEYINVENYEGVSISMRICEEDISDILEILIGLKVNLYTMDSKGRTILHYCKNSKSCLDVLKNVIDDEVEEILEGFKNFSSNKSLDVIRFLANSII